MSSSRFKIRLILNLVLCCCCLGPLTPQAQLHGDTMLPQPPPQPTLATMIPIIQQQQLFASTSNKLQQLASSTQTPISARSRQDPTNVGLAPTDRKACQLPPILAQRRHAAESNNNNLRSLLVNNLDLLPARGANNTAQSSLSVINESINQQQRSTKTFDSSERLRQLRQLMQSNNYEAYLVTHYDEHGMEYVSDYDRRLRFLSGFTGSVGHALILMNKAVLFTDGRYALQADLELDCNWSLVVSSDPVSQIGPWLKLNAMRGLKVTTDARLMPLGEFDPLDSQLKRQEMEFLLISQDLVDIVWNVAQSTGSGGGGGGNQSGSGEWFREVPKEPLFVHPLQFAGNISWQEKLVRLSDAMGKLKAKHYIISQLDDIAWLLNLRGDDIPMAPLFKSYLFISRTTSEPMSHSQNLQQPSGLSFSSPINNQQQQQQVMATSVEQLLMTTATATSQQQIQSPQVVQVTPTQTIKVTMYIDLAKITKPIRDHLQVDQANGSVYVSNSLDHLNEPATTTTRIQVELKDYDVFIMDIRDKLSPGSRQVQGKLLINSNANVAIHVLAKSYDDRLILIESLVTNLKAVKSDGEVQGMRLAHWRDSLAISMILAQLDHDIEFKGQLNKWTETGAAKELKFYRSLMDYNRGESFNTISAYGPQAAIVHYKPSETEIKVIGNQSTYLLDTGGQYLDGTTDITRTVHFGEPSEFQRETYTRVLMGAIDLMSLIFEQSKFKLGDLIARRHLFDLGLDYAHGTGHGIGLYSMVHEAPWLLEHYTNSASQLLTQTNKESNRREREREQQQQQQIGGATLALAAQPPVLSDPIGIQANMFTSVEPGYYKANDFGIRLENIVVTQKVDLPWALARPNGRQEQRQAMGTNEQQDGQPEARQFLRFEPISLVPFEPKLIKFELLSNKQKAWLNSYNLMVRLRMTQQINYYLAKIRNMSSSSSSSTISSPTINIHGTISSSRLYQAFRDSERFNDSASPNQNQINTQDSNQSKMINLGYYNFLRMEGSKLQAKLEQTHKWIMTKTERIPLDVPQSLVQPSQAQTTDKQQHHTFRNGNQQPTTRADSASETNLDGQKLMLAYMSSLPFNDAEASEAFSAISLAARPPVDSLSGRVDGMSNGTTTKGEDSTSGTASASSNLTSNKCSGLECDLWLVRALNSQAYQMGHNGKSGSAQRQRANWLQDTNDDILEDKPLGSSSLSPFNDLKNNQDSDSSSMVGSLMDMFKLNGSNGSSNGGLGINVWPVILLSTFVMLQVGLLTYVCRGYTSNSSSSSSNSNSSSSSNSNSNSNNSNNHHINHHSSDSNTTNNNHNHDDEEQQEERHPHNLLQRPHDCPRSSSFVHGSSSNGGSTSRRHKATQCCGGGHFAGCPKAGASSIVTSIAGVLNRESIPNGHSDVAL